MSHTVCIRWHRRRGQALTPSSSRGGLGWEWASELRVTLFSPSPSRGGLGWGWVTARHHSHRLCCTHPPPNLPLEGGGAKPVDRSSWRNRLLKQSFALNQPFVSHAARQALTPPSSRGVVGWGWVSELRVTLFSPPPSRGGLGWGWVTTRHHSYRPCCTHPPPNLPLEGGGAKPVGRSSRRNRLLKQSFALNRPFVSHAARQALAPSSSRGGLGWGWASELRVALFSPSPSRGGAKACSQQLIYALGLQGACE
jgi:hypothetical protein